MDLTGKKIYIIFDKNSTSVTDADILDASYQGIGNNADGRGFLNTYRCVIDNAQRYLDLTVNNDGIFLDDGGRAFERKAEALTYLRTQIEKRIEELQNQSHEIVEECFKIVNSKFAKYEGATLYFADTRRFNIIMYKVKEFEQCRRDVATYRVDKYKNGVLDEHCCNIFDIDFSLDTEQFIVPMGYVFCNNIKEAENCVLKALKEFNERKQLIIFNASNNAQEAKK